MTEPKEFYRYDYYGVGYGVETELTITKYFNTKSTPKGHWVISEWGEFTKPRWVNKTAKKRFCYPTKREALYSFCRRKDTQIRILERQLYEAKEGLRIGTNLFNEGVIE